MRPSVYVETTIPSYATARPSLDLIKTHRQNMTMLFWGEIDRYDLVTSFYVIEECGKGDIHAAERRLNFMKGIRLIELSDEIDRLGEIYLNLLNIPRIAKTDSLHLAVCVEAKIDYLLTWNCRHIGVNSYAKVYEYNKHHNLWTPMFVTPEMLMEFKKENEYGTL